MNVQLSQTIIIALVIVCATVLRVVDAIDTTVTASVLVGGLGWAGGHAAGVATAATAKGATVDPSRYFGGPTND